MIVARIRFRTLKLATMAAAAVVTLPAAGTAQSVSRQSPALSISAGIFHYDLSGVATTPMVALRADFPLGRVMLLEGGFGVARPEATSSGARSTMLTPEAQLQFQLPLRRVQPYLGVGGGAAIAARAGDVESSVTASAAGGVRAWLTPRTGVRAELRVRGIGSGFEGASDEWTVGFAWRF
jgi:hypothetical protein